MRRLISAFAGLALGPVAFAADPVVVTVRPSVTVTTGPVLVHQVAALSEGDAATRHRIGNLDVADVPRRGVPVTVLRELIACRIQLAGVPRASFRMDGPMQVVLSVPDPPGPPPAPIIKPRDVVTLTARVGGVRIVTRGEAMQEGRPGDKIRVRNVDSKREVFGKVVDRGTVEVEF